MPEPTKAQLAAENKALRNALKRESAACKREAAARQRPEQQAEGHRAADSARLIGVSSSGLTLAYTAWRPLSTVGRAALEGQN
jgi:hypothetical protein